MGATGQEAVTRVTSADGVEVAYWSSGRGPSLVVVHGIAGDHTRWGPLLPWLEPHVTVHAVDRRGRGASGDAAGYDVAREFEDVAAVVDAVARRDGVAVDLLGHSFGALCALGAATLTGNVRRLALYEPAGARAREAVPPGHVERLEELLGDGDREAVLETCFRELLGMPEEQLAFYRAQPTWPARLAAAHTLPRELRAEAGLPLADEALAGVRAPTLMLLGEHSAGHARADTEAVVAALPDARIAVLEGQEHLADSLAPELFASHLLPFLREGR